MNTSKKLWLIVALWGMIDLICALFCEIQADEAYYRLYAQYLSWGYFDHPPLVGVMIYLSGALVHGTSLMAKNLSVRLMTVLLHMGTVALTWKCIPRRGEGAVKELTGFTVISASMVMFSAYGFITAPDSPFLFFMALFLYLYKCYLDKPSWGVAAALGVSMAGMMYSKYFGVLVVALAVLSNWRLVKDAKLWCALGIGVVMFIPHVVWQYENGFPSIAYHMVERNNQWRVGYTLEYFPNQLLVFNPLAYILTLILTWRNFRSKDAYRRTLAYLFGGFQIFFLIMTVRGHVEPHWTMLTTMCAIIFLTEEWEKREVFFDRRWVRNTMVAMLCIVMAARVALCLDVVPNRWGDICQKKTYFETVHKASEGLPLVFMGGSFQGPSLYRFFYDDRAVLIRGKGDRYTQYDLLHLEEKLIGERVCLLGNDGRRMEEEIVVDGEVFERRIVEHLSGEDLR